MIGLYIYLVLVGYNQLEKKYDDSNVHNCNGACKLEDIINE